MDISRLLNPEPDKPAATTTTKMTEKKKAAKTTQEPKNIELANQLQREASNQVEGNDSSRGAGRARGTRPRGRPRGSRGARGNRGNRGGGTTTETSNATVELTEKVPSGSRGKQQSTRGKKRNNPQTEGGTGATTPATFEQPGQEQQIEKEAPSKKRAKVQEIDGVQQSKTTEAATESTTPATFEKSGQEQQIKKPAPKEGAKVQQVDGDQQPKGKEISTKSKQLQDEIPNNKEDKDKLHDISEPIYRDNLSGYLPAIDAPDSTANNFKPYDAFYNGQSVPSKYDIRIIAVTGPSGIGKSTLIKRLIQQYPEKFTFLVPHMTRERRPGEIPGIDGHFVSPEMFKMMALEEPVQFAEASFWHGSYYGTSVDEIEKARLARKIGFADVYPESVENLTQRIGGDRNAVREVYIIPLKLQNLEDRLRKRGTDTEEQIQQRLKRAKELMTTANHRAQWDIVIVNDNPDTAYEEFEKYALDEFEKWPNR